MSAVLLLALAALAGPADEAPDPARPTLAGEHLRAWRGGCRLSGAASLELPAWRLEAPLVEAALAGDGRLLWAAAGRGATLRSRPPRHRLAADAVVWLGEDTAVADAVVYTPCDRGPSRPAPWLLRAAHAHLRVGRRLVLYGARPAIGLPGGGELALTPPLPPLHLPQAARQAGWLAPRLGLSGGPWPTLLVPFFVPLGARVDVTVEAGSARAHLGRLPAARLGGRWRWAPAPGQRGHAEVTALFDPSLPPVDDERALPAPTRLRLGGAHAGLLTSRHGLHLAGDWVSDGALAADLGVGRDARRQRVLTSRGRGVWRADWAVVGVAADLGQTLQPQAASLQRAPAVTAHLGPLPLASWLWLGGRASGLRLGRFGGGTGPAAPEVPAQTLAVVGAEIWAPGRLGPLQLHARAAGDALAQGADRAPARLDVLTTVEAEARLPLARRLASGRLHTLVPALRAQARGLASAEAAAPGAWARGDLGAVVDAQQVRRPGRALRLSLRQALWAPAADDDAGQRRHLFCELALPWDLSRPLPRAASAELAWVGVAEARLRAAGVPPAAEDGPAAGPQPPAGWRLAALEARLRLPWRQSLWQLDYRRQTLSDEALLRGVGEALAPWPARLLGAAEIVHWLSGGVAWRPAGGGEAAYDLRLGLPGDGAGLRPLEHRWRLGYAAPDGCWRVGLWVAWTPDDVDAWPRAVVELRLL